MLGKPIVNQAVRVKRLELIGSASIRSGIINNNFFLGNAHWSSGGIVLESHSSLNFPSFPPHRVQDGEEDSRDILERRRSGCPSVPENNASTKVRRTMPWLSPIGRNIGRHSRDILWSHRVATLCRRISRATRTGGHRRLLVNALEGTGCCRRTSTIRSVMVHLSIVELEAVLQFTEKLARRAGNIILDGSKAIRYQTVAEKKNAGRLISHNML
jgi:hypothetical protein